MLRYEVNEKYPLISRKFSGIHARVIRKSLYRSLAVENEDPQWVFQDTGFALFEVCYPGFYSKIGRDSGMKVCTGCGMRRITIRITGLSRNLGWDDGIKRKFGRSRLQD